MARLLTPTNLKAVRFELSGLDEFVQKLLKLDKDVDTIFEKAINEIKEGIRADIKEWASKHYDTGIVYESVNASSVFNDGNNLYAMVGIDSNIHYDAWHAVFVEYGTPTIPADPGVRRAFDKWRKKSPEIFEKYLQEALNELD